MSEIENLEDLGTFYGRFYDEKRKAKSAVPEVGQIVFCPVTEMHRRPLICDVRRVDPYTHSEVTLKIREQEKGDYRGKDDRLPIKALSLERTHELVICRAKLRPCVVLAHCQGVDPKSVPEGPQRTQANQAFYPIFLLAPVFSVSTGNTTRAFGPAVTARIRCLMYPEFLYLRQSGGIISNHSVARLDRVFVASPHPGSGFEAQDLFLIEEIIGVALSQLRLLLGQSSKTFEELRAMMLSFLPNGA